MQNAIAFSNNDVVIIAWSYGGALPDCLGFAVYRIAEDGRETALPSLAVFPGSTPAPGQTTAMFPVQKFYWKDVGARAAAETTKKGRFRYKVVPLGGKPKALIPLKIGYVISNEVEVSAKISASIHAYFNRGLISTQYVSRFLNGNPSAQSLLQHVATPGDPLRQGLAGDMIGALTSFLRRTAAGGEIHAALYELGDEELVAALVALRSKLHVVLSNAAPSAAEVKGGVTDGNEASRMRLKSSGAEVIDRYFSKQQIGHNKFAVYVDKGGRPRAVLFGSTNWTSTGLCTQTNNTMVVDDPALAARYLAYWEKLKSDTLAAKGDPKSLQAAPLRRWDATSATLDLAEGAELDSWFSPNTPGLRRPTTGTEKSPPDMKEVASLVAGAKSAVLFLAFIPGKPSVVDWAAAAQKANRNLFVRGCVTNSGTASEFHYDLVGMTPAKPTRGPRAPADLSQQDPRVIAASALGKTIPRGWQRELLSAGHAITHDKIVVIDPFSDDCVVITGSHNLGYKASYNNDENLAIIRGERMLAEAYATHVLDVYDHFSWRSMIQTHGERAANTMLSVDPSAWQGRYFDSAGNIKVAQLKFWLSSIGAQARR